jgi:hypothetical protein
MREKKKQQQQQKKNQRNKTDPIRSMRGKLSNIKGIEGLFFILLSPQK